MSRSAIKPCPMHDRVLAAARDELDPVTAREVDAHLRHCDTCRVLFRRQTAGRFPDIPDYTILRLVNKGGFGVVYKAIHHVKQRIEALKLLYDQTPLVASYFENEVHLIAGLRHPNIATLYEANLTNPPLYYTMEFVDGVRLNEYVHQRDCSLAERLSIIATVARALHVAHAQGIVHRDIKPQNILVDADGQPHIVDFGIAKRFVPGGPREGGDGEWHEGPIGTRGYVAPEQARGESVDARADIYALGAVLFHCITGQPAKRCTQSAVRERLLRAAAIPRPEDVDAIIARCVEINPARRYRDCQALADDLDRYLASRPVNARAHHRPLYVARRVGLLLLQRHPLTVRASLLIGSALLLTVLAASLGMRVVTGPPPPAGTVLVAFTDDTLAAIRERRIGADLSGLNPINPKSWRLLHGRLMQRLAAARPRVVVWDYYFPTAQPQFDPQFVRGIKKLRAPVIIGTRAFDAEGTPQVAPEIAAAVDGVGALWAPRPDWLESEYLLAAALKRGFDRPRPSLALRAYAATRVPDAEPVLEITPDGREIRIYYRRRSPGADQLRWAAETDTIATSATVDVTQPVPAPAWLRPGDRVANIRVPARPVAWWDERTIPYERVLRADPRQLRTWFDGKAVLIGQMRPGIDQYINGRGESVFGCHVHADALDALLANVQTVPLTRTQIGARCLLWSLAASLWVTVTGVFTWRRRRSFWPTRLIYGGLFAAGVAVVAGTALRVTSPAGVELGLALGALLATGALTYWARSSREGELRAAPDAVAPAEPASTLSSTILAETD